MKIGIISDIHGNLPALSCILKHFEKENCKWIYCLGDSIAIGPFSKECINILLSTPNIKFIMGNHEEYFINGVSNSLYKCMSEGERRHQLWVAELLNNEIKDKLKEFPYIIRENIQGVDIAFMHYALNSESNKKSFKSIEKNITAESMDKLFEEIDSDLIFFGHEHSPCNIKGKKHYINVGSSGCTKQNTTHCTTVIFRDNTYDICTHILQYEKDIVLDELQKRDVPEREFISTIFFGVK